jgi:hypothetical protein
MPFAASQCFDPGGEDERVTAKLSERDTIAMQSKVTKIHEDGRVTVRTQGDGALGWLRRADRHLSLVAKNKRTRNGESRSGPD